jgi:hypothetical protein
MPRGIIPRLPERKTFIGDGSFVGDHTRTPAMVLTERDACQTFLALVLVANQQKTKAPLGRQKITQWSPIQIKSDRQRRVICVFPKQRTMAMARIITTTMKKAVRFDLDRNTEQTFTVPDDIPHEDLWFSPAEFDAIKQTSRTESREWRKQYSHLLNETFDHPHADAQDYLLAFCLLQGDFWYRRGLERQCNRQHGEQRSDGKDRTRFLVVDAHRRFQMMATRTTKMNRQNRSTAAAAATTNGGATSTIARCMDEQLATLYMESCRHAKLFAHRIAIADEVVALEGSDPMRLLADRTRALLAATPPCCQQQQRRCSNMSVQSNDSLDSRLLLQHHYHQRQPQQPPPQHQQQHQQHQHGSSCQHHHPEEPLLPSQHFHNHHHHYSPDPDSHDTNTSTSISTTLWRGASAATTTSGGGGSGTPKSRRRRPLTTTTPLSSSLGGGGGTGMLPLHQEAYAAIA